jgi:hypothetical protein
MARAVRCWLGSSHAMTLHEGDVFAALAIVWPGATANGEVGISGSRSSLGNVSPPIGHYMEGLETTAG